MGIFYTDFFGISKILYNFTSFPLLPDKFKVHPKWGGRGKIPSLSNESRTYFLRYTGSVGRLTVAMNSETLGQKLDTSLGSKVLFYHCCFLSSYSLCWQKTKHKLDIQ